MRRPRRRRSLTILFQTPLVASAMQLLLGLHRKHHLIAPLQFLTALFEECDPHRNRCPCSMCHSRCQLGCPSRLLRCRLSCQLGHPSKLLRGTSPSLLEPHLARDCEQILHNSCALHKGIAFSQVMPRDTLSETGQHLATHANVEVWFPADLKPYPMHSTRAQQ